MKVGFITFHSFAKPGGVKKHILGLSEEYKRRGIETKIICPRRKIKENYGDDVILLGTSIPMNVGGTQGDLCFNFNPIKIYQVLNRENFDILHFHNFILPSSLQILEKSNSLNILTMHANLEAMPFLMKMPKLNDFFSGSIKRRIDGIIGVAPMVFEIIKDYSGKKTVIPNGIDLNEFNPNVKKIERFCDDKLNILFVGRIEKRKGLIYAIKAYELLKKNHQNIRLIVVGEGPLEDECREYISENNIKDIYFEGTKTGQDLVSYYCTADIFCAPSIFGESFGIILLEAMACNKPVVGFSNKGYAQTFKDTRGEKYLVEPKDFKALAEKMECLILDREERIKMQEWGLDEVQKYSWPNIADEVLAFYQECKRKPLN